MCPGNKLFVQWTTKTVLLRATERIQKVTKLLLLLSGVNKTTLMDPNFYQYCLCGNIEIITEKKKQAYLNM
jgi:hypothetical protein